MLSSLFDGAILRRIFGLEKTFCIKIIYDVHKFSLYLSVYKGCRAKKNFCKGAKFFLNGDNLGGLDIRKGTYCTFYNNSFYGSICPTYCTFYHN